jgi:hypothetical protein
MADVAAPKTDRDWEVENAADTLIRAQAIFDDKKLLKAVEKLLAARTNETKAAKVSVGKALMNRKT